MKLPMLSLVVAVFFSNGCSTVKTVVTGAEITETGIYTADITRDKGDVGVASKNRNVIDNQKLVRETTLVPAKKGVRFGFRYSVEGSPDGKAVYLDMKHSHPPIQAPGQSEPSTESSYRLKSWIGDTYTSFKMQEDWEVVVGDWVFQVWHDGALLAEQKFTTYEK